MKYKNYLKQWNNRDIVDKCKMSAFTNVVRTLPVVLLLSLIGSSLCYGQTKPPKFLLSEADSLFKLKVYDQALLKYNNVSDRSYISEDWDLLYKSFSGRRKVLTKQRKYNQGLAICKDALLKMPDSLEFYRTMLNYHEGRFYFKQSQFHTAASKMETALYQLEELSTEDTSLHIDHIISAAYDNLSLYYARMGDQNSAVLIAKKGIEKTDFAKDRKTSCRLLNNIGKYLFHNNQHELAIEAYLNANRKCGTKYYTILYLVESYIAVGRIQEAKAALNQYKDQYISENLYDIDDYYRHLSEINLKEGFLDSSIVNQAKAISRHDTTTFNRDYIKDLIRAAELAILNENFYQADSLSNVALLSYEKRAVDNDSEILDLWQIEALSIKAKVAKKDFLKTKTEASLKSMSTLYEQIFENLVKIKSSYHSMSSKYRIGEYSQDIYLDLLDFYFDQYKTDNSSELFEKAFQVVQVANSFVLKEEMSLRDKLSSANVPKDTINAFLELRARFLSSENSIQDIDAYNSYKDRLLKDYTYITNYFPSKEIDLEEVREKLLANELLVKYHYHNEDLFVLLISKTEEVLQKINLNTENRLMISNYLKGVKSINLSKGLYKREEEARKSYSIYKLILGQFLDRLKGDYDHLLIIPDGPLRSLPFSSLVIKGNIAQLASDNYLLSKYASSYLYFASQLKTEGTKEQGGFVSLGIEYTDEYLNEITANYKETYSESGGFQKTRGLNLSSLKFADDEAKSIAELLGGKSIVNEDATFNSLKSALKTASLVHLSLHALVDQDDYLESVLLLSNSNSSATNMSYRDIMNLDLDNDLVVLSACETSLGSDVGGEGLLSISRALIQSGCKSSVGAYWSVPDQTTKQIMSLFYENLKLGLSKSKALQKAQLKYLSDDEISSPMFRSPYFWSAWAIYGADEPVYNQPSYDLYLTGIVLILLFGMMFWLFGKKKNIKCHK